MKMSPFAPPLGLEKLLLLQVHHNEFILPPKQLNLQEIDTVNPGVYGGKYTSAGGRECIWVPCLVKSMSIPNSAPQMGLL